MTADELRRAKRDILAALRHNHSSSQAVDVLDRLADRGVPEDALRVAMWDLIAHGEIKLTPDRRLVIQQAS